MYNDAHVWPSHRNINPTLFHESTIRERHGGTTVVVWPSSIEDPFFQLMRVYLVRPGNFAGSELEENIAEAVNVDLLLVLCVARQEEITRSHWRMLQQQRKSESVTLCNCTSMMSLKTSGDCHLTWSSLEKISGVSRGSKKVPVS